MMTIIDKAYVTVQVSPAITTNSHKLIDLQ